MFACNVSETLNSYRPPIRTLSSSGNYALAARIVLRVLCIPDKSSLPLPDTGTMRSKQLSTFFHSREQQSATLTPAPVPRKQFAFAAIHTKSSEAHQRNFAAASGSLQTGCVNEPLARSQRQPDGWREPPAGTAAAKAFLV